MTDTNPEEAFGLTSLPPISPEDQAELDALDADPPPYFTLFRVWREILEPAADSQTDRVGPGWAHKITTQYPQIKLQDMTQFRDEYFGCVKQMLDILNFVISQDPECLDRDEIERDKIENGYLYHELMQLWQGAIVAWEHEWDCEAPDAAVKLGVISEVHRIFFAGDGLTAFLDNIGWQMDDSDKSLLTSIMDEYKEGDHE